MESPEQRIQRVVGEEVAVATYNPGWLEVFRLASASTQDRQAYTRGKTEFIVRVTAQAKPYYGRA